MYVIFCKSRKEKFSRTWFPPFIRNFSEDLSWKVSSSSGCGRIPHDIDFLSSVPSLMVKNIHSSPLQSISMCQVGEFEPSLLQGCQRACKTFFHQQSRNLANFYIRYLKFEQLFSHENAFIRYICAFFKVILNENYFFHKE